MSYQILKVLDLNKQIIFRQLDSSFIPFDPDNTDYQQFKKDLANGVALNDAEGNAMTAEQITEFLGTLP
jgi:hypothetical protein